MRDKCSFLATVSQVGVNMYVVSKLHTCKNYNLYTIAIYIQTRPHQTIIFYCWDNPRLYIYTKFIVSYKLLTTYVYVAACKYTRDEKATYVV